jgi:hypothetical protein
MDKISGTKSQKLISYIHRVSNYLGLYEHPECYFEINLVDKCDAMAGGWAHGDDESVFIEIARNDYQGKVPMVDIMINIAHEMVHAKQLASGRLIDHGLVYCGKIKDGEPQLSFKRSFDGKEYIDIRYDDQPWEIEAYALEEIIYDYCK